MSAQPRALGSTAEVVTRLRRIARSRVTVQPPPEASGVARCDLCGTDLSEDHRHLLHREERRIMCSCEPCWAMRAGDPELKPTGTRVRCLDDFQLSDELWAKFQIPIGLAFFFLSEVAGGPIALYPSPAGATECELYLEGWDELRAANPIVDELEPEAEALIINRMSDPHEHAIVPIDRCYELVGLIKSNWTGISGGSAIDDSVRTFFAGLRDKAGAR